MSHFRKTSHLRRSTWLLALFGTVIAVAGVVLFGTRSSGAPIFGPRAGGDARLLSVDPMPDGEMCQWEPASATESLFAELNQQVAEARPEAAADLPRPSDATKLAISK